MRNAKGKLLASFLLPACTSVSMMSGSIAFARKATKVSKVQNTVASQKNASAGASERRSTKVKVMSTMNTGKKTGNTQAVASAAKVTKKIVGNK